MRAADLVIVPAAALAAVGPARLTSWPRKCAVRARGHPPILPVLSMIDLRRTLHRDARDANPKWPAIPLASAVEQCAVERKPVAAFGPALARRPRLLAQLVGAAIERKLASPYVRRGRAPRGGPSTASLQASR